MIPKKVTSFYLEAQTREKLQALSQAKNTSISNVIAELVQSEYYANKHNLVSCFRSKHDLIYEQLSENITKITCEECKSFYLAVNN